MLLSSSLSGGIVGFAPASREGGGLSACIEVGDITKAEGSEGCDAAASFLGINGRHRRGGSAKAVPQGHWRYTEKVRKKHTFKSKVAKDCFCIGM